MSTSPQDVPSNIDFATEVKSDRLNLLWKVTLGFSLVMLVFAVTLLASVREMSVGAWIGAPLVMGLFCILTQLALKQSRFEGAAMLYTFGGIAAVTVAFTDGGTLAFQVLPFFFVLIIFVAGLLLHPTITLFKAVVCALITIFIPFFVSESWAFFGGHQIFAIALMFLSAGIGAQVTGELYAVTEWALLQYQRQLRTNMDLFDKRRELQRTLQRTEALSEQLKETNVELEDAHQAAESAKNFRGQFLANMSHELRTPLNAIIGFSETMLKFPMMYDDTPLPENYKNDLNQIYTSGRQLLHLINDILDLAKVDAGKLETYMQLVDLAPILDSVLTTANGLIGTKPVELVVDIPSPLPKVWADETRVRQVLLNLYSNACKFTEVGSITLKVVENEDEILFTVSDTGAGVDSTQLELIFQEFEQGNQGVGRDPRAGAGLGLAISKQLLTLMGGRIWAESELHEGSTFYFTLQPYHKAKLDTLEHQVPLMNGREQSEITVLGMQQTVFEDSPESESKVETPDPLSRFATIEKDSTERDTDEMPGTVALNGGASKNESTQESEIVEPTPVEVVNSTELQTQNQEKK